MNAHPLIASEHRVQAEEFRRKHRTGLLTLVFMDIVGSTRLKHAHDAALSGLDPVEEI